jgi:hypothetical protein
VRTLTLPVLEPSIFLLKDFKPAEWITVHRQKINKLAHRCSSHNLRSTTGSDWFRPLSDRTNVGRFQMKENSCFVSYEDYGSDERNQWHTTRMAQGAEGQRRLGLKVGAVSVGHKLGSPP